MTISAALVAIQSFSWNGNEGWCFQTFAPRQPLSDSPSYANATSPKISEIRLGLPVQPLCLVYTPNLRNNFNYSDLYDKNNA